MTTQRFVDSLDKPTLEQARQAKAAGYEAWAGYIAGNGVPHLPGSGEAALWGADDWAVIREAEMLPLPIVSPDFSFDQSGKALAEVCLERCAEFGIEGAAVLDTEYEERSSGLLVGIVNEWNATLRAAGWEDCVYTGAGYSAGAHILKPAWSANGGSIGTQPPEPPAGDAIQWAGNIDLFGILVDLDQGNDFPFARWVVAKPIVVNTIHEAPATEVVAPKDSAGSPATSTDEAVPTPVPVAAGSPAPVDPAVPAPPVVPALEQATPEPDVPSVPAIAEDVEQEARRVAALAHDVPVPGASEVATVATDVANAAPEAETLIEKVVDELRTIEGHL